MAVGQEMMACGDRTRLRTQRHSQVTTRVLCKFAYDLPEMLQDCGPDNFFAIGLFCPLDESSGDMLCAMVEKELWLGD